MFDYTDGLDRLQVELSTVCNALCLGCVRTDIENFRRTRPFIPKNKYLDIELILNAFTSSIGRKMFALEFCGNIDEPFAHPRLAELLERLFVLRPEMRISLHTNGGWVDQDRVRQAARAFSAFKNYSVMRFSLDGLEDTNHIYRQGVSWSKVERNLKICVEEGVRVIWQFLVFPWNKHQIEEARNLAAKWGCAEFWVRPDRSLVTSTGLDKILARKALNQRSESRPIGHTLDEKQFLEQEISCSFKRDGMAFLSWEGKVWPCCFISNIFYKGEAAVRQFEGVMNSRYPENFNSLYHHTFDEVLSSPLFKNDLMESWTNPNELRSRCADMCSVDRRRSSDGKPDDRTFYEQAVFRRKG